MAGRVALVSNRFPTGCIAGLPACRSSSTWNDVGEKG